MSLFGALAPAIKASDGLSWGDINSLWSGLGGGYRARSGVSVSWVTALRVTTFLACTRRLAEAVSTVPTKLYQRTREQRSRTEAFDHPVYDLLNSQPNEWQDSLQFKETLAVHFAAAGNAYAFINRVQDKIVELIPIVPTHVQVKQATDLSLVYTVTALDGTQRQLSSREIFHLRGLSWDGFKGLDIVQMLQEPLGLALATEQTHAMLHANGMRPSGMLSAPKTLDKDELVRLAAWVKRHYSGLDNVSRVMVLDNDIKFTPFDMKGIDAQHLQLREHEIESICHGMGVLPIVIGYPAAMAARAAAETLVAMHLVHTVRPLHRRFEKAFDRQLLTADERKQGFYTKFIDAEFLRATAKDRAAFYQTALGGGGAPGWATTNDICDWEDMDSVEGGDVRYMPANLAPIGPDGLPKLPPAPAPAQIPGPPGGTTQGKAFAQLFTDFLKTYDPAQARDDHGRWGGGAGVRTALAWAKDNIAAVAGHPLAKEALIFGINSLLAHGSQMHGSYLDSHVEAMTAHFVNNSAVVAAVTAAQARDAIRSVVTSMADLRKSQNSEGKAGEPMLDPVLEVLRDILAALDRLDARNVGE